jgi:hypothetical protein
MRRTAVIEKTGLGKTSIDELDPSYGRKLALEQAEGSAESAPIISPNKCFESRQVFEGAEIIVGWFEAAVDFCAISAARLKMMKPTESVRGRRRDYAHPD